MKIKRFFAADTRQAIRMVREDQGSDAVILSNRRVKGGIEIIAAVDYDEAIFAEMQKATQSSYADSPRDKQEEDLDRQQENEPVPKQAANGAEWAQDPAMLEMRHEIRNLRGILENQLSQLAWGEMARREPQQAAVVHQLMEMGISYEIASTVATQIQHARDSDHAWTQALALLAHKISVTDDDILDQGGVVALVGPTGVGKTTTVAKLAARFTLRHGHNQVALVSTDNYRIGAHEQLLNYGRILGVPSYVVESPEQLKETLADLSNKRLVLIDTAGMSHRDMRLSEQLSAVTQGSPLVRFYLALSANTQLSALHEIVNAFRSAPLVASIITKTDETSSMGDILSVLVQNHLPIAYVSDGQRVPEDLHPARAHRLVSNAASLYRLTQNSQGRKSQANVRAKGFSNAHV